MIRFTDKEGKYNFLSPFSKHPIQVGSVVYNSVAHYYTYKKFRSSDPLWSELILKQQNVRKLILMSNSRTHKITSNWDSIKYKIMEEAYRLKFDQHIDLKKQLINLNSPMSYNCGNDFKYWRLHLGELLMKLKSEYTPVIKPVLNFIRDKPLRVDKIVDVALIRGTIIKPVVEKEDSVYDVVVPSYTPVKGKNVKANNSWLSGIPKKVKDIPKKEKDVKDILVISLDYPNNKIENAICIPLAAQKKITGIEVEDEVLISISKKISKLSETKKIVLNDSTDWYNNIIQNLSLAIVGKNFAFKSEPGIYVQGILDRNSDIIV